MKEKIAVPALIKDPKHKRPFPDDITDIEHVEPGFKTHTDFDWPELERLLGEAEASDTASRENLGWIIHEIIAWAIASKSGAVNLEIAARRVVALAWIVNPELFQGASATEVARKAGCSPDLFHRETGNASRKFGIRSHGQSHAGNFKEN